MGDWSYLALLLDRVQSHSTVVGKIWMSVLFLFRIFVLGAAADKVWGDEVSDFYCDSQEPGCKNACYNYFFPISYVHYWVLQITFVTTPTLVYLGHAIHIIHKEKRMLQHTQDMKPRYTDDRGKVRIKGILFGTYLTQLVFKILLEVAFTVGQFYLLPLINEHFYHCKMSPPCARYSGATCYTSRPTEKLIFIIFMLAVSGISVLLNIIEIIYLVCNNRRQARKRDAARALASVPQYPSSPEWRGMSSQYRGFPLSPLPCAGLTDHRGDQHDESIDKEKDT
ncbi:gap junction Cx32.2 protein-like [Betta splendens]|uniref:Gap junction Cx32.2 protein-like n=1 Tax=Betta splendens TaxID=158456 RepID=A0A6P7LQ33_BETSP|nr:gap junction Cx32.2 protein-like [Betta splendens]